MTILDVVWYVGTVIGFLFMITCMTFTLFYLADISVLLGDKKNLRKRMKYKQSEIELWELIKKLDSLNPIKIVYNKKELYNDDDSKKVIEVLEDGGKICGERLPPDIAISIRHPELLNKLVYSIKIDIVLHHHSIVVIKGEK